MTINPGDRDFIESNKVYFEQAKMKFLHGFAPGTMDRFYEIYKRYINPGYILTPWCSECVIDMVTRLGAWYSDTRDQDLIATRAGADAVANSASLFPNIMDSPTVHYTEADLIKNREIDLDPPPKRGKGRPKKKR